MFTLEYNLYNLNQSSYGFCLFVKLVVVKHVDVIFSVTNSCKMNGEVNFEY